MTGFVKMFLALMFSACLFLSGCASYNNEPIWDSRQAPEANDGYYEDAQPSDRLN